MSLSSAEIAALVTELQPLVGSRVDAVRVHAERALTLELYGRAGPATLLISAEADLTRLHAVRSRPPSPEHPFAFQAVARAALEGARLASLGAAASDRVVEVVFERGPERVLLVAELTGRHGNVFLVGGDGVIRASAGRNLSTRRKLVAGERYAPPSPRPGRLLGIPPHPGPLPSFDSGPHPRAYAQDERATVPDARFSPVAGEPFPLSAAVEAFYREKEEERALAEARRRLREPLRAALARSRRALEKLAEEAARVPAAEADRRGADLIKDNLRRIPRGAREAVLTEYTAEGPREVTVALDPALSPRENMERAYRRYRRIAESGQRVAERTAEVRARVAVLSALLSALEDAAPGELARIEREARKLAAAPRALPAARKRPKEARAVPYRLFRTVSGAAILVGKSAQANDALTLRVARGNDLWLHVRGRTGSHVVLRLEKGAGPDQEALLDAAHLAVHFSDARGEPAAEVAYTRAKHVRKPRGAAPGAVVYSQERTLALRFERERLDRLLASEEDDEV